jgi:peptide methionine sulfoxide reductase MsrA
MTDFQFQEQIYKQTTGLAMGAPSSPTFSEIHLQYKEHSTIYEILLKHNILGYFRYVDDILIVYDTKQTDITEVLNSFNKATHPLQFTIEK